LKIIVDIPVASEARRGLYHLV